MNEKKLNLGGWITSFGAITNLLLYPLFFFLLYKPLYVAESSKTDVSAFGCAMVVKFYYPMYTDLGVLSGIIYMIAAYYYFHGKGKEGDIIGVIAVVNGLMWSFWPAVPALDTGNPGYHLLIFTLNFVYYLVLTLRVLEIPVKRAFTGMLMGMAMITTFMNGIANTNRIIIYDSAPIYVFGQRLSFIAGLAWMVIVITMILWPNTNWLKPVVLATSVLSILTGMPLGIDMSIAKHTFSMFLLGSIFSAIILVLYALPNGWENMVQPNEK